MNTKSIAVVIPLYKPEPFLAHISRFIKENSGISFLLIVSRNAGVPLNPALSALDAENSRIVCIPQNEFNHGATREFARKQLNTDVVVFLTQDAIPACSDLLEKLAAPLLADASVAVSYARQIPHDGADIFEAFPREYNYGTEAQTRGLEDASKYGVYTFFCSNSCAAWKNAALDEIGGFKTVLTNEDYFAVADLLQKGYKVAYAPDAVVKHSHRYTLWQEFQRYFDTGYVRAQNPVIQQLAGQAERRGVGFLTGLVNRLWREQPLSIPYALLQSGVKWLGYRTGFLGVRLPLCLKRRLSQQAYYWASGKDLSFNKRR
jgi:rhamnosyltransferase